MAKYYVLLMPLVFIMILSCSGGDIYTPPYIEENKIEIITDKTCSQSCDEDVISLDKIDSGVVIVRSNICTKSDISIGITDKYDNISYKTNLSKYYLRADSKNIYIKEQREVSGSNLKEQECKSLKLTITDISSGIYSIYFIGPGGAEIGRWDDVDIY